MSNTAKKFDNFPPTYMPRQITKPAFRSGALLYTAPELPKEKKEEPKKEVKRRERKHTFWQKFDSARIKFNLRNFSD